jgi:hypothetical protein
MIQLILRIWSWNHYNNQEMIRFLLTLQTGFLTLRDMKFYEVLQDEISTLYCKYDETNAKKKKSKATV